MSDAIKPVISHTDKAFNKEATYKYKLSIQLSLDGFSFCVLDTSSNRYIAFELYSFHKVHNSQLLCEKIDELIKQIGWLRKSFKSVKIIYVNQKSTLVPFPLFEEKEKKLYLSISHKIEDDEDILHDKLNNLDAYNLYTIPQCLKKKLKELFPAAQVLHFSSSLIENLLIKYKYQDTERKVYVHVQSGCFEMIIMKGKELIFYNSFKYEACEDFVYYILFVFEQLKVNPEIANVSLLGEIEKDSTLYQVLYKYIRNISFEERNDTFQYSYVFDEIPPHFYYNLFNLNLCE